MERYIKLLRYKESVLNQAEGECGRLGSERLRINSPRERGWDECSVRISATTRSRAMF